MSSLATIIREINRRSRTHLVGQLQEFRKTAKGLSRIPSRDIFSRQTTFGHYAFHNGGRTELQFNVAFEDYRSASYLRHGVALSFKRDQTLVDPRTLLPKLKRLNAFISSTPETFSDFKMWWFTKSHGRTDNKPVSLIHLGQDFLLQERAFVFIGRLQARRKIDYELILADFDLLFPLYQFVEATKASLNFEDSLEESGGFKFEPRLFDKRRSTIAKIIAKQVRVELRENRLQSALRDYLRSKYGKNNVSHENRITTARGSLYRADIVVRRGKSYWLYELKVGGTIRHCIRRALGQLLEYSFWPGSQEASKLIIVGEESLTAEASQYISRLQRRFALPVEYQQFDQKKGELVS